MAYSVSFKFGIVAMLSGLFGVPLGSFLAQYFRKTHQRTDPIICAWGLFISAPLVYIALILARYSNGWCFFVIFLAELSLNLCWSIVADILLVSKSFFESETSAANWQSLNNWTRGWQWSTVFLWTDFFPDFLLFVFLRQEKNYLLLSQVNNLEL